MKTFSAAGAKTMLKEHHYQLTATWTGNLGSGTSDYRAYSRDHEISGGQKHGLIPGSSDPAFRGDGSRYNPEELLVAALSTCHMLWVLHLCAEAGIVVTSYEDSPVGTMRENQDGSGEFIAAVLHPRMTIADGSRIQQARSLHHRAHQMCFIARSVNFPVSHEPEIIAGAVVAG
ncbi:MAG: OsmC family protein [Candidatus Korobacteraceae bacterium]|jgi:organic hydroperoxide reductase OsmC/OhrA